MFLFPFLFILNIILSKSEKLIFAETLSRHGARAPLKLNDEGLDLLGIKWSIPGELTPIGKRMEYLLGLRNRQRYITGQYRFLSEVFDPHELIVFSSDINRTLQSMTSQLQGLYPMSSEKGDTLTQEQFKVAVPPINISIENISEHITLLNYSALPNYMTIIPIHFISLKNTSTECQTKINELNDFNSKNKNIISNLVENFNKNYSEILNNFYGRPKDYRYDIVLINEICDSAIADNTEGKNISDFLQKIKSDKNEFLKKCKEVLAINFRDYIFGDEKNEVIKFYNSPIFKDMINYMKKKINDNIIMEI